MKINKKILLSCVVFSGLAMQPALGDDTDDQGPLEGLFTDKATVEEAEKVLSAKAADMNDEKQTAEENAQTFADNLGTGANLPEGGYYLSEIVDNMGDGNIAEQNHGANIQK